MDVLQVEVSVRDNKYISNEPVVKTKELPQNQLRRMKYWELDQSGNPSRPDISALDGIRFILRRIYSDSTINLDSSFGKHACSFEEFVGILLKIRDELIIHESYEAIQNDASDSDGPMKIRMAELAREGFEDREIKEVIKMEFPIWIRSEIFCWKERSR